MHMKHINGAYLADTARVFGDVTLGENVNLWFGAVIRGDVAPVTVGPRTNLQDNAVIHCDYGHANHIGADVTIGHNAIVHGETIGDGTLIGMGARVLGRTRIGKQCLIAAGAVVPPGLDVPDRSLVIGVPGRIVREVTDDELQMLADIPPRYVNNAKLYHEQPAHPRNRPYRV